MRVAARISGSERPFASSRPTRRFRLRSPVQVSTRSPRPLKPASVSRRPAGGAREARQLGEPARDERRQRVVPEAQPFDDAGRDRDDVLHRAADLHAHDIVAAVETEVRPAELGLHQLGRRRVGRRRENRRGQLPRHLHREARARHHDHGARRPDLLRDHLGHAQQRVDLEALRRAHEHRPGGRSARPLRGPRHGIRATESPDTMRSRPRTASATR